MLIGLVLALTAMGMTTRAEPKTADEIVAFSREKCAAYQTWSADMRQTMNMMGTAMTFSGHVIQKLPFQVRMEMDMPMFGQTGKMITVVGPDRMMWHEVSMAGQRQVIKMDSTKLPGESGLGVRGGPTQTVDPTRQLDQQKEWMNYVVAGAANLHGQAMYILDGTWKEAALTNQQVAGMAGVVGLSRIYVGQRDGFLHKMESFDKSGTNLVMMTEFIGLKFNEDLPDSTFTYQPPPGVTVLDMTPKALPATESKPAPVPTGTPE